MKRQNEAGARSDPGVCGLAVEKARDREWSQVCPLEPAGRLADYPRDKLPNIGDVLGREGVKVESPCHGLSSVQKFVFPLPKVLEELLTVDGFDLAGFQVIVSAVEHFARLGKFVEVTGNDILHQFAERAPGFACQPIELRLEFRGKVYFHDFSVRNGRTERNG